MARWLITRPIDAAASTAAALAERGEQTVIAPLTRIVPRQPARLDLSGVQALVVTSANAARRLADLPGARDLPVLAVGDATAQAARRAGAETVRSAGGDGAALGRYVLEKLDPKAGALVWLRGQDARARWRAAAQNGGFAVRQAIVYVADPVAELPIAARDALAGIGDDDLKGVLLFSPRAASLLVRLAGKAGLADRLAALRALCLSGAVADAARVATWGAVQTAPVPTEAALLDLVARPPDSED